MKLKYIVGPFVCLVCLGMFILGAYVALAGLGLVAADDAAGGGIEVVFEGVGRITGLNGRQFVFACGIGLVVGSALVVLHAYKGALFETKADPNKNLALETLWHFSPTP